MKTSFIALITQVIAQAQREQYETYRVNHDAKGGMELTDAKPKGHVEDNRSESVKDKDHEYKLRSRGRIVKS